jgi:hypothetical protein
MANGVYLPIGSMPTKIQKLLNRVGYNNAVVQFDMVTRYDMSRYSADKLYILVCHIFPALGTPADTLLIDMTQGHVVIELGLNSSSCCMMYLHPDYVDLLLHPDLSCQNS